MPEAVVFERVIPRLRIFSVEAAEAFYLGYLGFTTDWVHTLEEGAPTYRQVRRGELVLHLSEHHGDGSPGAAVFVAMRGLAAFHAELTAKPYRFLRPAIERAPWGASTVEVTDPFGNRILFCEYDRPAT